VPLGPRVVGCPGGPPGTGVGVGVGPAVGTGVGLAVGVVAPESRKFDTITRTLLRARAASASALPIGAPLTVRVVFENIWTRGML
jgi:hypothetical protein